MPRGIYQRKPKKAPIPRQLEEIKSHPAMDTVHVTEKKILMSFEDICKIIADAAVRGYKQK